MDAEDGGRLRHEEPDPGDPSRPEQREDDEARSQHR
jgi:hypothetical protein